MSGEEFHDGACACCAGWAVYFGMHGYPTLTSVFTLVVFLRVFQYLRATKARQLNAMRTHGTAPASQE